MNSFNSNYGFFPDEVIILILARLPIKSLFRTKCVSKTWYNIISDKFFTRIYNEVSVRNPMLIAEIRDPTSESRPSWILVDNLRGVSKFSLDFIKDRVKVRASCNGLLCCSSIGDENVYYVCNPMTKEYRLLPENQEGPLSQFYPYGGPTLVGLACNILTMKYNVVVAGYQHRPEKIFICMVFDSETNKWRKLITLQDYQFHLNVNQVVLTNGALHWITASFSCLIALDLCSETWRRIQFPSQVVYGGGNRIFLLESDGKLSVVRISDAWMNIWVMEDYEREEWTLVDRVSLRCIGGTVPAVFPISQSDKYVFLATYDKVLVYQRKTRVWMEMYSEKNTATLPLWCLAHGFRSSIASTQ